MSPIREVRIMAEMRGSIQTQKLPFFPKEDSYLITWINAFLVDRKAGRAANGTLRFYTQKLKLFVDFCGTQLVTQVTQIDANLIRQFLLWLESTGHNKGGIHGCYRTLRCFLYWWEGEVDPPDWRNPIHRVKAPKQSQELLDPVPLQDVKAMLETCEKDSFVGVRDRAMLLCLLDTGARASEFLAIDLDDLDQTDGQIAIRHGKGDKGRLVFLGKTCRRIIRAYLKLRKDRCPAFWVTVQGNRLGYDGLRAIVTKRAKLAQVDVPSIHSFRRQFALSCLRAGMDVYSLQVLMGHADLQVLRRYLKQSSLDTREAHRKASPVDGMKDSWGL